LSQNQSKPNRTHFNSTFTSNGPNEPYLKNLTHHQVLFTHSSQSQVPFAHTSPYFRAETVPFGLFFTLHCSLFNAITTLQPKSPTSTHSSGTSHFHFLTLLSIGSSFFLNQIFVFYLFFLYPFDQFINFHEWVIPILR